LIIEEIRYDFEQFRKHADEFIHDLIRLMIISKMNCTLSNTLAKDYFVTLIKQIPGCEAYIVKYGQPILYIKYKGIIEFTDQKVTSQFVRINEYIVDVIVESIFEEFVKTFDNLASTPESKIKWGLIPNDTCTVHPLFVLFNSFVDNVHKLTLLDPNNPDSLMEKKFSIRNVNVAKYSTRIEFLINNQVNIVELNPSKKTKDDSIVLLFGSSEISKTLVSLMKQ
jgi:hypothetical protein